jgi:flagellar protein FliS
MNAKFSYRQTTVQGASPVRLVVLLYEQVIQDLTHAMRSVEKNDIEQRTRQINHALTVLGYLQSTLNFENGGEVAQNLNRLYNVVRAALTKANALMDQRLISEQIDCLLQVREAWLEAEKSSQASAITRAGAMPSGETQASEGASADTWEA